jgi:hypothetical protein
LRAIDHWDIVYWRKRRRENHETAAYQSRQRRRAEILRQLTKPPSQAAYSYVGLQGDLMRIIEPDDQGGYKTQSLVPPSRFVCHSWITDR